MFLKELKNFSRQNWWVYLILIIVLLLAYFTWKWNIIKILFLFLLNFFATLFTMIAIWNYSEKKNKIGSIYHITGTSLFIILSLYGVFFQWFYQYIIFQLAFAIAAIKAFSFYNYNKDIKIFNEKTMVVLNLFLLIIFIIIFKPELFAIFQGLWFAFVTIWSVSIKDSFRYFWNLFGTFFIITGSIIWIYLSYNNWNIDWISLWYALLTMTALIYFLKLLPKYITKK